MGETSELNFPTDMRTSRAWGLVVAGYSTLIVALVAFITINGSSAVSATATFGTIFLIAIGLLLPAAGMLQLSRKVGATQHATGRGYALQGIGLIGLFFAALLAFVASSLLLFSTSAVLTTTSGASALAGVTILRRHYSRTDASNTRGTTYLILGTALIFAGVGLIVGSNIAINLYWIYDIANTVYVDIGATVSAWGCVLSAYSFYVIHRGSVEATGATPRSASIKSSFGVLFTTVFLDFFGFFIVLPYLFFLAQSLGATPFVYGLLITSYALMQFVFAPILGKLSDHYGRRRVILLSLFGAGVSYFVFGIASSLWLLFAARILAGCTSSTLAVAQSYVADVTAKKARLKYMGILGGGVGLGMIVGPAIGGVLSGLFGYAAPSFLASTLAFSNVAAAYFRLPEPASRVVAVGDSGRLGLSTLFDAFKRKAFTLLLPAAFISSVAFVFENAVASPWLQTTFQYGPFQVGLIFAYCGVVYAFTQGVLVPKLSRRYAATTTAIAGLVSISIAYVALGTLPVVGVMLLMAGVLTVGFGLTTPSISALISLNAEEDSQGSALGAAGSLTGLAEALTPSFATSIFSFGVDYGMSGFVMVIAAVVNSVALPVLIAFTRRGFPGASRITRGISDRSGSRIPS